MNKKRLLAISVVLFSIGTQSTANANNRYIVTFDRPISAHSHFGKVLKTLPLINAIVVETEKSDKSSIHTLSNLPGVLRVEKDAPTYAITSRPSKPQQIAWGVAKIGAPLAWSTSTGKGVKVAILDTGVNKSHPDLKRNVKGGFNTSGGSHEKYEDGNGHGTHVSGIVAAVDNRLGVVGVAPEASIYGVKVLDNEGSGNVSNLIEGINWAIENKMDVINMSLGFDENVVAFHEALDAAYEAGIVLVAAAGNEGDGKGETDEVGYPAKYDSVIAVAATASDDTTPTWSSQGKKVEIAAPGVDILSTIPGGYDTFSGTSMACPHIVGVVALLLATDIPAKHDLNKNGKWDPQEVRAVLQKTATDKGAAGHDPFYGHGLVDSLKAVTGTGTGLN